ncbi:MAG: F0F1 ATP synthase subunit delta [Candidatus Nanopelagicales bacterium]
MIGSSRASYAGLRAALDERRATDALPLVSSELSAVAALLSSDRSLSSVLADAGQPPSSRQRLAEGLLGSAVSPLSMQLVTQAVNQRWSQLSDLIAALEGLSAQALFLVAEKQGHLDEVEGQLFAFSQSLQGSPELGMALTDPAVGTEQKSALLQGLLELRADPQVTALLVHALTHLRGQRPDAVVKELIDLSAEQRSRSVAVVRVARELEPEQSQRLAAALSRLVGREVQLNVSVDPAVVGGAVVRVGEHVFDGTVAARLAEARRAVAGASA